MELLHSLCVMVIIGQVFKECCSLSANVSNGNNKKLEEFKKEISLEIQKLQKGNEYLLKEIKMLHQKTNINFEY